MSSSQEPTCPLHILEDDIDSLYELGPAVDVLLSCYAAFDEWLATHPDAPRSA